jgi:hypothetical protein
MGFNGKKENHPVPKRRDLTIGLVSRSENHPVKLHQWRKLTPLPSPLATSKERFSVGRADGEFLSVFRK